ncbi:MAG: sulfide/dihydroorotate dehydrogenase-like FAD/NAD-binding protein [Brevinematales bacterium]|jgi:ferredoxin--NADP+ reductase
MFKIKEIYTLAPGTLHAIIEAPLIAGKAEAGQFIIIRTSSKGERIPLTIADYDRAQGTISIVFQVLGKSTTQLAALKPGGVIPDLLGPQGNPSEMGNFGNVAVVGGGVGIAAAYPIVKSLKNAGSRIISINGFRSRDNMFWMDKMEKFSDSLLISTNDGSCGRKGFVTDVLRELLDNKGEERIDRVIAIGPAIMMKSVADLTRNYNLKTIVSLNSLMVCGMGMCGACRVTVGGKTNFTCMDGPDFDGHLVDFKELMMRLDSYKHEEKTCLEKWNRECAGGPQ